MCPYLEEDTCIKTPKRKKKKEKTQQLRSRANGQSYPLTSNPDLSLNVIALKVIFIVIIIKKKIVYRKVKQKSDVWITIYHVYEKQMLNNLCSAQLKDFLLSLISYSETLFIFYMNIPKPN